MSNFDHHLRRLPSIVLLSFHEEGGFSATMWSNRGSSLFSAVLKALEYGNPLGLSGARAVCHYMCLENLVSLSRDPMLSEDQQNVLCDYLACLPGYQPQSSTQSETVLDMHGYMQMQLIQLMPKEEQNDGGGDVKFPDVSHAQLLIDEVIAPLHRHALVVLLNRQFDAWLTHHPIPSISELTHLVATLRPDLFDDAMEVRQCLDDVLRHPSRYQRPRHLSDERLAMLRAADLREKMSATIDDGSNSDGCPRKM